MWSYPNAEEKATEYPEFYSSSAEERPLETTGLAGTGTLPPTLLSQLLGIILLLYFYTS